MVAGVLMVRAGAVAVYGGVTTTTLDQLLYITGAIWKITAQSRHTHTHTQSYALPTRSCTEGQWHHEWVAGSSVGDPLTGTHPASSCRTRLRRLRSAHECGRVNRDCGGCSGPGTDYLVLLPTPTQHKHLSHASPALDTHNSHQRQQDRLFQWICGQFPARPTHHY